MSILTAQGLAKAFGANDVFAGIELKIEDGDRIGLVGPNGQGKTTLLRILSGVDSPSAGSVYRKRGLTLGYLPQDPPPVSAHTLWEDVLSIFDSLKAQGVILAELEHRLADPASLNGDYEALLAEYGEQQAAFEHAGGYTYENRAAAALSGLGFAVEDFQRPLSQLSGGQRTRGLLAKLLLREPELLLLDEPTNHLDLAAVEWLEGTLLKWKGSIVTVTHDRYFLDQVCTRIWDLEHRRLESYRADYSHYVEQKAERLERQRAVWEAQQKHIAETEEFVRRYGAGQRSKEARGRQTRLERFKRDELIERPVEQSTIHLKLKADFRSGDRVLWTDKLEVGYRDAAEPLFSCPNIELRRGERAALIGPNGTGKTTFLRTLLEEIPPFAGQVRFGAAVKVGYLAQAQTLLDPSMSVMDAILAVENLPLAQARNFLALFLFRGDDVFKKISELSGGQRSRVALARLTLQGANLLLLDEPTNHLDLASQDVLENVLSRFNGTILLVSHDRYLVQSLATQVWALEEGRLTRTKGGYDQYLAERTAGTLGVEELELERGAPRSSTSANQDLRQLTLARTSRARPDETKADWEAERTRAREERRQRKAAEQRAAQVNLTERRVADLEATLAHIGQELNQASTDRDTARVAELGKQYAHTEQTLHQLIEQWATLLETQP